MVISLNDKENIDNDMICDREDTSSSNQQDSQKNESSLLIYKKKGGNKFITGLLIFIVFCLLPLGITIVGQKAFIHYLHHKYGNIFDEYIHLEDFIDYNHEDYKSYYYIPEVEILVQTWWVEALHRIYGDIVDEYLPLKDDPNDPYDSNMFIKNLNELDERLEKIHKYKRQQWHNDHPIEVFIKDMHVITMLLITYYIVFLMVVSHKRWRSRYRFREYN